MGVTMSTSCGYFFFLPFEDKRLSGDEHCSD
jgi:hypothetical protein